MPTVDDLSQTHATYDRTHLERMRGLYEGGDVWRQHVTHWLPKLPEEPASQYANRRAAALYENHFGPALDLLTAHLFSERPNVEGVPESGASGDYWSQLWDNANRRGESWDAFWRDVITTSLWAQRAWVRLETPEPTEDAATEADQVQAGDLDVYLCELAPETVINWRHGPGGLEWVVLRWSETIQARPLDKPQLRHWWAVIDRAQVQRYYVDQTGDQAPKPTDGVNAEDPRPHAWGRVPVLEIVPSKAIGLGARMRDPAVAHLRQRNELSWALRRAAVVLLKFVSRRGDIDAEDRTAALEGSQQDIVAAQQRKPGIGHAWAVQLWRDQDGTDDIGFVEPAGSAYGLLADDVERLERAFYRVIHQAAVAADPRAARVQSAASKNADWMAQQIVMSAIAPVVLDAMRDAVKAIGAFRGDLKRADLKGVQVTGMDGWQSLDVEELTALDGLLGDAKQASPTLFAAVAKLMLRRLNGIDDDDRAQIERELDAYEPPEAVAAASVRSRMTPPELRVE